MSEDLGVLVKQYKNRQLQVTFYVLAFLVSVPVIILVRNRLLTDLVTDGIFLTFFTGPIAIVITLSFLILIYSVRIDSTKTRLRNGINELLIIWKLQAVEDTIKSIETEVPVPLEKIETYSHTIIHKKFNLEFPSLNLHTLQIIIPDTVQTIQELLSAQPFLGTYHQVEQQFVKNFENESKV